MKNEVKTQQTSSPAVAPAPLPDGRLTFGGLSLARKFSDVPGTCLSLSKYETHMIAGKDYGSSGAWVGYVMLDPELAERLIVDLARYLADSARAVAS